VAPLKVRALRDLPTELGIELDALADSNGDTVPYQLTVSLFPPSRVFTQVGCDYVKLAITIRQSGLIINSFPSTPETRGDYGVRGTGFEKALAPWA
jgi:hypothetical protein